MPRVPKQASLLICAGSLCTSRVLPASTERYCFTTWISSRNSGRVPIPFSRLAADGEPVNTGIHIISLSC